MKQTKKKKPKVFRTLIWCIHSNAKMNKNIDDEKPDGKNRKQKQQPTLFFGR